MDYSPSPGPVSGPFLPAVVAAPTGAGALDSTSARRLLAAFLAGRSPNTLAAYGRDLEDFRAFSSAPTVDAAAAALLAGGQGAANGTALAYRAHLQCRGLAAATVNRRLAAVRSLVRLARTLGLVPWALDVEGPRSEGYRDTRGPGVDGVRRLLQAVPVDGKPSGRRDRALLLLLYHLGLRRNEAVGLDLADVDLPGAAVWVLGKGRSQRERISLPPATAEALAAWVEARGSEAGPLFVALDPAHRGHRLTGQAVYAIVRRLGEGAGVKARPHMLRHAAITRALDLTGGDIRAVQKFSRHRDVRVIQRYDDCRRDLAGDVARRLAGE